MIRERLIILDAESSVLALHMGENFKRLSPLLQKSHIGINKLEGTAIVKRGNIIARIICSLFGFPRENPKSKLRVDCEHTSDSMVWMRDFDGLKMESSFERQGEYLIEFLGPLSMYFKAVEKDGELHYLFIKTKFIGVFLPNFLSPQVVASEKEVDGKYRFSVEVRMFWIGVVIAYSGELKVHRL